MRTHILGAGAVALVALTVGSTAGKADAALLGITSRNPDVSSNSVWMTYTVTDAVNHFGTLTAHGSASLLTPPVGSPAAISNGTFDLTAKLHYGPLSTDPVTAVAGSSLSITGDAGSGAETFFSSSTLSQFGFSTSKATYDFWFSPGAGTKDASNGPIGVILHEDPYDNAGYLAGLFTQNFGNGTDIRGYADAFPVPEPATVTLLGTAVIPLLLRRRRKA